MRVRPHSEVEPDLMVRPVAPPSTTWERAPRPILVVEITSDTTRRRDYEQKRQLYLDLAIPDYLIVDTETREIWIVQSGHDDVTVSDELTWHPAGAPEPWVGDVRALFREGLGADDVRLASR